jgi:tyrosinase
VPDVVVRPSVELANVEALRDAYSKMQALPESDNRSWLYWAGFHGYPRWDCWHHARIGNGPTDPYPYDLFLPWHRAYLMYWDNVVRDQNPDAIQPWWDWTADLSHAIGVPEAFSQEEANGVRNSLFNGPTPDMPDDPARLTRRFPGDPGQLPTADQIDALLRLGSFIDFSVQIQDVHDKIHGWTGGTNPANPDEGGDMGTVASAACDPIFWAHHAMIDRLWYIWQVRNSVTNIPPDYLDQVLAPFGYTVVQVLDIRLLGYEYASSVVSGEASDGGAF